MSAERLSDKQLPRLEIEWAELMGRASAVSLIIHREARRARDEAAALRVALDEAREAARFEVKTAYEDAAQRVERAFPGTNELAMQVANEIRERGRR